MKIITITSLNKNKIMLPAGETVKDSCGIPWPVDCFFVMGLTKSKKVAKVTFCKNGMPYVSKNKPMSFFHGLVCITVNNTKYPIGEYTEQEE